MAIWPLWDQLTQDGKRREQLDKEDLWERRDKDPYAFTRPRVTGHELIDPDAEDELLCVRVAKAGMGYTYRELWSELPASQVYRMYALAIASEYDQQLTERDVPKGDYDPEYQATGDGHDPHMPDFA